MKTKQMLGFVTVVIIVTIFLSLVPEKARAQTPTKTDTVFVPVEGNPAMPSPVLIDGAVNCLVESAYVLPPHDAAKFCLKAQGRESDRATDAAKAQRPVVVRYTSYGNVVPTSYYGGREGWFTGYDNGRGGYSYGAVGVNSGSGGSFASYRPSSGATGNYGGSVRGYTSGTGATGVRTGGGGTVSVPGTPTPATGNFGGGTTAYRPPR